MDDRESARGPRAGAGSGAERAARPEDGSAKVHGDVLDGLIPSDGDASRAPAERSSASGEADAPGPAETDRPPRD